MKKKVFVAFCIIVILINLISLSCAFIKGNKTFDVGEEYAPKSNIEGWINISLNGDYINSSLTSNFQGSIGLKDFLDANSFNEGDYTCFPSGCGENYISSNGLETKSFSLNYGEKILALKLNGQVSSVSSLSFDVSADNALGCTNPLIIDILNDNIIEWKSKKLTEDYSCTYENGRGCFDENSQLTEVNLAATYCEKIGLTESGKFILGAWVKKGTTSWSNDLLKMELYNLDGSYTSKYCDLPEPSTEGGERSCNITYENSKIQQYYVCIKAKQETDYKIKKESVNSCGFYGSPSNPPQEKNDYYIFARGAKFDNIGNFKFNQAEYALQGNSGNLLKDYIYNYIASRYNGNCTNGCSIPLKFKAYGNLDVTISNISLGYSTSGGSQNPENKSYDASTEKAKVYSDYLVLDLSYSNITLPDSYGDKILSVYLSGIEVLRKEIYISHLPVIENVFPTTVPAASSVLFTVKVAGGNITNITKYKWTFGDGTTEETTKNYVKHAYPQIKTYNLKIDVENENGEASKNFAISSVNPKDYINFTISNYKKRLTNITSQLAVYPAWYKKEIEKKIEVEKLNSDLTALERRYSSAGTSEDFVKIMDSLTKMNVPYKISKSGGGIPLLVKADDINPAYLSELGAGTYKEEDKEAYQKAVAKWVEENLQLNLEFNYISAYYDNKIDTLVGVFKLKIKPNEKGDNENYVVIGSKNVVFDSDYKTKELADGIGITFSSLDEREIGFAIPQSILINNLKIYLSPEFNKLELVTQIEPCNFNGKCESGETWKTCRKDCKPWGWVVFFILLILLAAAGIYLFLQWWYVRRYESYLFKNRNDLYNITNFVINAKSRGLSEEEIKEKLKKAGWKSEQIVYAIKKVRGEKIEMPLTKLFQNLFKKREEIFGRIKAYKP